MDIDLERWREGTGYDLTALAALDLEERITVERHLTDRLYQRGSWRELEALLALGTPGAIAEVNSARQHPNPEVREYAIRQLLARYPEQATELEEEIIQAVEHGSVDLAEEYPTARVKQALLHCARTGDAVSRVHAAAMLMFLCGRAAEPFDWNLRPFFLLRFGEDHPEELRLAWTELKQRTGL